MKRNLLYTMVSACLLCLTSCGDLTLKDDNNLGFATIATIVGDAENGFYCYGEAHASFIISYEPRLAGIERGYFDFIYKKEDYKTLPNGKAYIDNAHLYPITLYDIIRPLSQEEAEDKRITDKTYWTALPRLEAHYIEYGYMELGGQLATFNDETGEKQSGEVNVVYDPTQQDADTLRLQVYYHPVVPEGWKKTSTAYNQVSCDLSSLASLREWNDSLTVLIDYGSEKECRFKASKNDFRKPQPGECK